MIVGKRSAGRPVAAVGALLNAIGGRAGRPLVEHSCRARRLCCSRALADSSNFGDIARGRDGTPIA